MAWQARQVCLALDKDTAAGIQHQQPSHIHVKTFRTILLWQKHIFYQRSLAGVPHIQVQSIFPA